MPIPQEAASLPSTPTSGSPGRARPSARGTIGACGLVVVLGLVTGCVSGREVVTLRGHAPASLATRPPGGTEASELVHVVTWNVHKADHPDFPRECRELLSGLSAIGGAVVLCLQEVRCDTFGHLADAHGGGLSGHYAPSWSFPLSARSTGVLTVTDQHVPGAGALRVPSPVRELGFTSPKVSLQTVVPLGDGTTARVVNCHALNFVTEAAFERQMEAIFAPLRDSEQPVVVCGDFNVWSPARLGILRAEAAEAGLAEVHPPTPRKTPAPRWLGAMKPINGFDPSIHLDRVFARGLQIDACYFVEESGCSDHQPLVLRFRSAKGATSGGSGGDR